VTARYRQELDGFLDRAEVVDELIPTARVVVAAVPGREITVRLRTQAAEQRLLPTGVRLKSWKWFVTGTLDGEGLGEPGLPLADITSVNAEET